MSTLNNDSSNNTSRTFAKLLAMTTMALALTACNSFDPNLGATPFRCGTDSPRCPDNYTCVTYSADDEVCESNSAGVDRADSGPAGDGDPQGLTCNNDSEIEPNNSIADATRTTIPSSGPFRLVSLAICPTGDQDFFQFDIAANGIDVVIEIEYMAGRGGLGLELLKGDGSILSTGAPVDGNLDIVRVAIPNIAQDTYIARVFPSETGNQNNYAFEISLSQ
jgi:hypothetical protein